MKCMQFTKLSKSMNQPSDRLTHANSYLTTILVKLPLSIVSLIGTPWGVPILVPLTDLCPPDNCHHKLESPVYTIVVSPQEHANIIEERTNSRDIGINAWTSN